ncbi:jg27674 [Pararge aegeria aegeria]|uniref:Jg27674 protein n=1 Tax=Pararge aegeria aegeria TaxID=348720 RepID=A0A8S4RIK0_9NEOP|nr:jg27674 [Pararge aegeria aegeria]
MVVKTLDIIINKSMLDPNSTILGRLYPAVRLDSLNVVCPPGWGSTNAAFTGAGSPFQHLGTPTSIGSPSDVHRPVRGP